MKHFKQKRDDLYETHQETRLETIQDHFAHNERTSDSVKKLQDKLIEMEYKYLSELQKLRDEETECWQALKNDLESH